METLEMRITLLDGKIVLDVAKDGGNITSRLERVQPEADEDADDAAARLTYNGALDGIESLILAHACAGIDVAAAEYQKGVQTALDAIANNLE
jgi:hypothetical protein